MVCDDQDEWNATAMFDNKYWGATAATAMHVAVGGWWGCVHWGATAVVAGTWQLAVDDDDDDQELCNDAHFFDDGNARSGGLCRVGRSSVGHACLPSPAERFRGLGFRT